jgi:hypothetical protein
MQIFNELFLDTVIQLEALTLNYGIVSLAKDNFFSPHNSCILFASKKTHPRVRLLAGQKCSKHSEFLKYYCSSKNLTSYTFLSLSGVIYYSDSLCYLICAVFFPLRKKIVKLYTWDTIDQVSPMKAFQPTIIDPAEAPKPLVTHTTV